MLSLSVWSSNNESQRGRSSCNGSGIRGYGRSWLTHNSQYARLVVAAILLVFGVTGNAKWARDHFYYVTAMMAALWMAASSVATIALRKYKLHQGWSVIAVMGVMSTAKSMELLMISINHVILCSHDNSPCYQHTERAFNRSLDAILAALSIYSTISAIATVINLWRSEIKSHNAGSNCSCTRVHQDMTSLPRNSSVYNLTSLRMGQLSMLNPIAPPPPYEQSPNGSAPNMCEIISMDIPPTANETIPANMSHATGETTLSLRLPQSNGENVPSDLPHSIGINVTTNAPPSTRGNHPPTTGETVPTNCPSTTGETIPTNSPPTTGVTVPTNSPPTTGVAIPTNSPQTTVETLSTNSAPTTRETVPTNSPPTTGETIPTNCPPTTGVTIPTNPPPTTGETVPTNSPPTTRETVPTNPPPTTGETIPTNSPQTTGGTIPTNASTTPRGTIPVSEPATTEEGAVRVHLQQSSDEVSPQNIPL